MAIESYIDKEAFCVMTLRDKCRIYLYFANRSVSRAELMRVVGVKHIAAVLNDDFKAGWVTRGKQGHRPAAYALTQRGRRMVKYKRSLSCVVRIWR